MRSAKLILTAWIVTTLASYSMAETCDAYIKDYGAISGVVPNLQENGTLKSLSLFGEGTFIAPKSSLISTARRQAEMKAKRDFSEWIQQKVAAGSLDEALTESIEQTNADQTTTGSVDEIKRYSEYIGSNTESVLSGIIKLDECVDANKKVIYVRMGWKPKLSEMAADTRATIDNSVARGERGETSDSFSGSSTNKNNESGSSGLNIITVTVEGIGEDATKALNAALKQAVSQVFGEQFQAETSNSDLTISAELTSSSGTSSAVLEESSVQESIRTKTNGIIHSYKIISQRNENVGVIVTVDVKLAKYDKGIDGSKKSVVILKPTYSANNFSVDANLLTHSLQEALENALSTLGIFNILDREHLGDIQKELNFIAENGDMSEIARLGNSAGADRIIISKITSYQPYSKKRQIGDKEITTSILDAIVAVKVIDPATTQVILSKNVVIKNQQVAGNADMATFVNMIVNKEVSILESTSDNKSAKHSTSQNDIENENVKNAAKEIENRISNLRSKSNNDW